MTRIRNVLQSRAERFRRRHGTNVSHEEEKYLSIRSLPYDDETEFTGQCIIPKMDPVGAEPDVVSSGSIYSLEAKDTRATLAETFSSGEENTAYSDDYNENEIFAENQRHLTFSEQDRSQVEGEGAFIDLAYEVARQKKSSSSEGEFVDLVRESARTGRVGVDRSNYTNQDEKEDDIVTSAYLQPETIEFVDSEDGKVFEIPQKEVRGHDGLIQNTSSLDDTYHDECSKTLNTNHETLITPYMPSKHEDDIGQTNSSERFRALQVKVEEEEQYKEYDEEASGYGNNDYDEEDQPISQENSELYDCDDGQMYIPDPTTQGNGHVGQPYELERDGTFFEQMRSVSLRNTNDYQTHSEHLEMEPKNWQAITRQIHSEHQENEHLNRSNDAPASPQLEDPYLSDSNSSWEEGSFGTGASRAVSRVDYDDEDDDAGTYNGTLDGTECYSDDEGDRPFVRILKKFRDMNVDDQRSDYGSDDEEDEEAYEDGKKRTRSRQERSRKSKPISVFERIGEIGMDLLNETIEHAERQDRAPRQNSANQGGTIINSLADLFSCGAPSGY